MPAEPLLLPASLPALSDAAGLAHHLARPGGDRGAQVRSLLEEIVAGLAVVAARVDEDLRLRRRVLALRALLDSHLLAAADIEAIGIASSTALEVLQRAAASAHRELRLLSADSEESAS